MYFIIAISDPIYSYEFHVANCILKFHIVYVCVCECARDCMRVWVCVYAFINYEYLKMIKQIGK